MFRKQIQYIDVDSIVSLAKETFKKDDVDVPVKKPEIVDLERKVLPELGASPFSFFENPISSIPSKKKNKKMNEKQIIVDTVLKEQRVRGDHILWIE